MADDHIIDVTNLNKTFGDHHVVNNVSLKVKKGEVFGFLGPNGSGKTTTIRMICGLLLPDSGSGTCLGLDIIKDSLLIRNHVGYMTQKFSLYDDLTIAENLNFIATVFNVKHRKQKVKDALKDLDMATRSDQLAGDLSGGWKQRLALAAAKIHDPQVLLLDEPTGGVDPKARRIFWEQIHELSAQGITTLVSTHYMDEASRCTRLAYISYGKLITEGTVDEVIEKANLTSWNITGNHLYQLEEELKTNPAVEQSVIFGNTLHICGSNKEKLNTCCKQYEEKYPQYHWTSIAPSLEDVFIAMVTTDEVY